jgi:hypothetical protein
MAPFEREIWVVGRSTGNPPLASLDQRLHGLVEAGLDEFFLVMTVRWALGYLIWQGLLPSIRDGKSLLIPGYRRECPLGIGLAKNHVRMPSFEVAHEDSPRTSPE